MVLKVYKICCLYGIIYHINKFINLIKIERNNTIMIKGLDKIIAKATCATKKMNGDSQLIVVLVLIIIAIALCVIFQASIKQLMNRIFISVNQRVNNMIATDGKGLGGQ